MLCHIFWSQVEYKIVCFNYGYADLNLSDSMYVCCCFKRITCDRQRDRRVSPGGDLAKAKFIGVISS